MTGTISQKTNEGVHNSCFIANTLWVQLEDTVLLIGTLLLFDPALFPIMEV